MSLQEMEIALKALRAAVQVIRTWHGMDFAGAGAEKAAWDIYYANAPEMAPIRQVFGQDPTHGWIVDSQEVAR